MNLYGKCSSISDKWKQHYYYSLSVLRICKNPELSIIEPFLQCRPNIIELIFDILLRFKEKKFGIVADIRKAFLHIADRKKNRDFLHFLRWSDPKERNSRMFRHRVLESKVPPFFSMSLNITLKTMKNLTSVLVNQLLGNFYVHNVVVNVHIQKKLEIFIADSKYRIAKDLFKLWEWEHTEDKMVSNTTKKLFY